ncbi:MAG: hypothetical protein CSA45_01560 [Gammaproteobacteria bacterium]|nr:MAG: hypothetical protein CSA45_01560 [Gammaproteobacteria bacterium]
MVKCTIKSNNETILNYFDKKNKQESKKCLDKPKFIVSSSGKKIQNTYRNSHNSSKYRDKSQRRVKVRIVSLSKTGKKRNCSSKGGTITIDGRVFHIDPNSLCNRYNPHRRVRLAHVDKRYRREISPFVNKIAKQYGLEPAFVHAVISAESGYQPNATSPAGAMGLMQLMPSTADHLGVDDAYDPHQNIRAGTKYLKELFNEFGTLELTAASYNAGKTAVRKYNRIPPYRETLDYVPKVMGYYHRYKQNKQLIALK